MTWTYGGDPSANTKDSIRFTLGDTIEADPLLTDEEILSVISTELTVLGATACCCEALSLKFARMCNSELGPLSQANAQKYDHYTREARRLRKLACMSNAPTMTTPVTSPIFTHDMMTEVTEEVV